MSTHVAIVYTTISGGGLLATMIPASCKGRIWLSSAVHTQPFCQEARDLARHRLGISVQLPCRAEGQDQLQEMEQYRQGLSQALQDKEKDLKAEAKRGLSRGIVITKKNLGSDNLSVGNR